MQGRGERGAFVPIGDQIGGKIAVVDGDGNAGCGTGALDKQDPRADFDLQRGRYLFIGGAALEDEQRRLNGGAGHFPLPDEIHAGPEPLFQLADGNEGAEPPASRQHPVADEFGKRLTDGVPAHTEETAQLLIGIEPAIGLIPAQDVADKPLIDLSIKRERRCSIERWIDPTNLIHRQALVRSLHGIPH